MARVRVSGKVRVRLLGFGLDLRVECSFSFHVLCGRSTRRAASPLRIQVRGGVRVRVRVRVRVGVGS